MILSTESAEKDGKTLSWHALAVAERSIREEYSDSKAPVNPTLCQHFLHGTPTKMFAGSANGQMVEVFYCRCRLCDDLFILGRNAR